MCISFGQSRHECSRQERGSLRQSSPNMKKPQGWRSEADFCRLHLYIVSSRYQIAVVDPSGGEKASFYSLRKTIGKSVTDSSYGYVKQ